MDVQIKKLKIGIYNPYFDSLGGGERYVLTLAEYWSKKHDVSIFWDDASIIAASQKRFQLDLSKVSTVPNVFQNGSLIKKMLVSMGYDCIVFLSDGSVPLSFAKKNILHFQVPFQHVVVDPWKKSRYQQVVCNSEFTKKYLDSSIGIPISVIYPPVAIQEFASGKKENSIVSIGRFNSHHNVKKQDVLISVFKEMIQTKKLIGWRLILAGGMLQTDVEHVKMLQKMSSGYPIDIIPNASFKQIQDLYARSRIYWHGAGFEEINPMYMEHFGISTVEAMAAQCIPIVFAGGGQTEIVSDGVTGFIWHTKKELAEKTINAMKKENSFLKKISDRAKDFSKDKFCQQFDQLLLSV